MRVSIDFYNNTAVIALDGDRTAFFSAVQFTNILGFDFPTAKIIAYEPDRNIFAVERIGGVASYGPGEPEIRWITDNTSALEQAVIEKMQASITSFQPTWNDQRIGLLYETDWMVTRHRDQRDIGADTSINEQQFLALLQYRQALRDLSEGLTFPSKPEFLVGD